MKRVIVFSKLVSALVFSTLIFSCGEEETPPEVTPSINIITPSANDLLNRTIDVEAEVTQSNFSRAKIFLADVLVGESTETAIKVSFNTKQFADGIHKLKILATDKKGKEVEASIDVEIMNTLFTISIPATYLAANQKTWFFFQDYQGTLLGVHKFVNNETFTFETPENYERGKLYILHQILTGPYNNGVSTTIRTYTDVKPGNFWVKAPVDEGSTTLGNWNYQLSVNDVPVTFTKSTISGEFQSSSVSRVGDNYNILFIVPSAPSNMFCVFNNPIDRSIVPRYKYIENVSVGQSTVLNFSNFTEMDHVNFTFDSQMDRVTTTLTTRSFVKSTLIEHFTQNNISSTKLYYPGNAFNDYGTSIETQKGNRINTYSKLGAIPVSYKTLNANVSSFSFTENNFSVTATGTFDYLRAQSVKNWITPDHITHFLAWFIVTDGTKQFKMVDFPSEILSEFPHLSESVVGFEIFVFESDGYESYYDYIRFALQSSETVFNKGTEGISSTFLF